MKSSHPSAYFNNIPVSSTSVRKHLGMLLYDKLSYEHHLKPVLNKVKKTIGLLRKFQQILVNLLNPAKTVFDYNLQIVHSASFRLWKYCL